jgi:hypothetical protein
MLQCLNGPMGVNTNGQLSYCVLYILEIAVQNPVVAFNDGSISNVKIMKVLSLEPAHEMKYSPLAFQRQRVKVKIKCCRQT